MGRFMLSFKKKRGSGRIFDNLPYQNGVFGGIYRGKKRFFYPVRTNLVFFWKKYFFLKSNRIQLYKSGGVEAIVKTFSNFRVRGNWFQDVVSWYFIRCLFDMLNNVYFKYRFILPRVPVRFLVTLIDYSRFNRTALSMTNHSTGCRTCMQRVIKQMDGPVSNETLNRRTALFALSH